MLTVLQGSIFSQLAFTVGEWGAICEMGEWGTICEIDSKLIINSPEQRLIIKTPVRRHSCPYCVFNVNFEHISHLFPFSSASIADFGQIDINIDWSLIFYIFPTRIYLLKVKSTQS